MKKLASENRKRLPLITVGEELGFGRSGNIAQIERHIAAGHASRSGNTPADGSRIGESVVAGPALAALALEYATDGEGQAAPWAVSSPVPSVLHCGSSLGHTSPGVGLTSLSSNQQAPMRITRGPSNTRAPVLACRDRTPSPAGSERSAGRSPLSRIVAIQVRLEGGDGVLDGGHALHEVAIRRQPFRQQRNQLSPDRTHGDDRCGTMRTERCYERQVPGSHQFGECAQAAGHSDDGIGNSEQIVDSFGERGGRSLLGHVPVGSRSAGEDGRSGDSNDPTASLGSAGRHCFHEPAVAATGDGVSRLGQQSPQSHGVAIVGVFRASLRGSDHGNDWLVHVASLEGRGLGIKLVPMECARSTRVTRPWSSTRCGREDDACLSGWENQ